MEESVTTGVNDVPGRSSILIHKGNTPSNTEGCLMPRNSYSNDRVDDSKNAYNDLNTFLKEHGDNGIRIIISNQ